MIPPISSCEASGGKKASTLTSSRTEPMTPSTWELTSRPTPRTRMQTKVVVMAVVLIKKFRGVFFWGSPPQKTRLKPLFVNPPPPISSCEASGGKKASTLTSSRTEPMTPSTWELTSRPTPRTRMQTKVVVMAVMLIRRFRRMFLRASRRKKPGLNLICVSPLHLVADHAAILEGDDPLAHHINHLLVVGRDEYGGAHAVDAVQKLHDAHRRVRVEVAGRLVRDEYRRLRDEGPGDRDALLLPAGELVRELVQLPGEANEGE